jgi:hypothetical protein
MRGNILFLLVVLVLISLMVPACVPSAAQPPTETDELSPVSTATLLPISTPDPIVNPIVISKVERSGGLETIFVTNISNMTQDITGFTLFIKNTTDHINFPTTILEPGTSLKVYNGPDARSLTDGLFWRDQFALNNPGDTVILLNFASRAIWYYVIPR